MRRLWGTVLMSALLAGCAQRSQTGKLQVSDSAGVRVVTNRTLTAPEWTLTEPPQLDLGTTEGGGPTQFFGVTSARRLPDGRIAIVNGGTQEIRIFDRDGTFEEAFGREGKGPGEFGRPGPIWCIAGDSLAIWDLRLHRLGIFDARGAFGRFVPVYESIANPLPIAVFSNASMVLSSDQIDGFGRSSKMMYTDLFLVDSSGSLMDTLPREPLGSYALVGDRMILVTALFAPHTLLVGDAHGYWVGTEENEEVLRYSATGELSMVLRWPAEDRTVSPSDVEREQELELEARPEADRPSWRQFQKSRPIAKQFAAYGMLATDALGDLWVREYQRPGDSLSAIWRVFNQDGALSGVAHIPDDDKVLDIGRDYVLTLHRDAMDVEHIRLFGLSRVEPKAK